MGKSVKKIVVTGAAGQIAYSLLFRIASGQMLGENQPIQLSLLEIPQSKQALEGVVMELEDCAFPLLKKVEVFTSPSEAFGGADIALLIGAKPRMKGMERGDLLFENAKIFIEQGKALNDSAPQDILVFVVGNPCNTNAFIAMHHAPKIDRARFFSMTCLDENRARALLAKKAQTPVEEINQMIIWGNHSSTQVPDFTQVKIGKKPILETIQDREWLEIAFIEAVQKRGASVIAARGKSSAASAANAVIDSIRQILGISKEGKWFSLGVCSDDNPYGVEGNLIFSFPCLSKGEGEIEIVPNLLWDEFIRKIIAVTEKELIEERELIRDLL